MSSSIEVVSFNQPITPPGSFARFLAPGQVLSTGLLSVIKPEFKPAYMQGISFILRGVMRQSPPVLEPGAVNSTLRNPFGLLDMAKLALGEQTTSGFIPFVYAGDLHLFDDPGRAAANYHADIILRVNMALEATNSNLRLEPVTLQ